MQEPGATTTTLACANSPIGSWTSSTATSRPAPATTKRLQGPITSSRPVLAAGRAVSRPAEIGPPQRSHTRYSPVTTRWAARSRRACLSMACTWARSNATVAPSGSCSSSLVVRAEASTMPSHWRINESISRTVRARSSPISSCAARRCAAESTACSVGSSTTSPTPRAGYPIPVVTRSDRTWPRRLSWAQRRAPDWRPSRAWWRLSGVGGCGRTRA